MQAWFSPSTRAAVKAAVQDVESRTNAEIVVAVRKTSGTYFHADLLGGLVFAFASLAFFLYYPEPFAYTLFPLEQLVVLASGAFLTNAIHPLRRVLSGRRLLRASVDRSARATFMELRLGRTRGRNAVLVYVSIYERRAFVVCDVGLDEGQLGPTWIDLRDAMNHAVRDNDVPSFLLAVRAMGPILATEAPHTAADTNELPDDESDEAASATQEGA